MSSPDNKDADSTSADAKSFSRTPTSWDAEDDILLMHLKDQQKLGWKEIASHFNNRTPNACQFRWRRLKLGNLKNPPKLASALGTQIKKRKKEDSIGESSTGTGFPPPFLPIANFTGYETNALAGLNALSQEESPFTTPSTSVNSPNPASSQGGITTSTYESPKLDSLDPRNHSNSANNVGGGYYTDILIDPTLNLPHNQSHPSTLLTTPRNLTSNGRSNSVHHPGPSGVGLHNNLIIQIARDDRTLILLTGRSALVSSLPLKLMNIPHHQTTSNALAHLPILFGGSISGPLRNASISGPGGISHSNTVTSLRNSSISEYKAPLGGSGYYSRSGSVVIPYNADKTTPKEPKEPKESKEIKGNKEPPKKSREPPRMQKPAAKTAKKAAPPVFKIPWSIEEDELLINRRNRELSFAELLILLPQRTEGEIWSRIDHLEKLRNGHRALTSLRDRRRRQLSIGLDDVDDFYDYVIGGDMEMSDEEEKDDDDDEALVEVEMGATDIRKRRKRRASLAVNPYER